MVELPVRKVDVLLCDWMGSMLLHDSLLPVLLRVRDRCVGQHPAVVWGVANGQCRGLARSR
jgi:hypothetical protein